MPLCRDVCRICVVVQFFALAYFVVLLFIRLTREPGDVISVTGVSVQIVCMALLIIVTSMCYAAYRKSHKEQKNVYTLLSSYSGLCDTTCAICIEEISPQNCKIMKIAQLNCRHVYHQTCFETYMESTDRNRTTCPLCRMHLQPAPKRHKKKTSRAVTVV